MFATEQQNPYGGQQGSPRFLIPSPEVWMKELLAGGFGSMYQLGHCFRNAEIGSPHHSAEFTMLEWYTVNAGYMNSADHTEALLEHLCRELHSVLPPERAAACRPPALRLSVAESFERYAGIAPQAFESLEHLREAAGRAGISVPAPAAEPGRGRTPTQPDEPGGGAHDPDDNEAYDDLFQRIFLTLVEENLPTDRPVILTDYPSAVPTLAEASPGTPFARRWELYLAGVEVANCYAEERDPDRLASYLRRAGQKKRKGLVPHPSVEGFVEFARAPACSGVALGVDRLLMALTGATDIRDVIFSTTFGIFREPHEGRG